MNEIPNIDWMQVKLNIEPGILPTHEYKGPCWHVDEDDDFCLRAHDWLGHDPGRAHDFVSLEEYIKAEVGHRVLKAIEDDRAVRAEHEFLSDEPVEQPEPVMTPFGPLIYRTPSQEEEQARKADYAWRVKADEIMLLTEVLKANPGPELLKVTEDRLIELLGKAEVRDGSRA